MTKLWDLPHGITYRWECKIQVCIPTFSHPPWTAWMHTNATIHKLSPALKKTLIALNHLRHSSTQGMKQVMIFECNQLQDFSMNSAFILRSTIISDSWRTTLNTIPTLELANNTTSRDWKTLIALKNSTYINLSDQKIKFRQEIMTFSYSNLSISLSTQLLCEFLEFNNLCQFLPSLHPAITRLPAFANDMYYASQFSIRTCGCVWVPFECWICGADFRAFAAPEQASYASRPSSSLSPEKRGGHVSRLAAKGTATLVGPVGQVFSCFFNEPKP